MLRKLVCAVGMIALAGCSSPSEEDVATTSATSEQLMVCGWLSGGTCTDLPLGNWRSPDFWADFYLAKYAKERKAFNDNVEPGPTPLTTPRTVLLITGVTIKAEWFDGIKARLERDGFKTVVYEPPALLSGDLLTASNDLKAVVEKTIADSGEPKIDILAECTGGVIARYYIQSMGGDANINRMVTFVSPEHGIAAVPLVHALVGWPALRDLSPGSSFLRAVNDAPLPADVKFTSIYTCTDEYIQPYMSSNIPGATNIELCSGFIGHFQTMYDPKIYMLMHDALIE